MVGGAVPTPAATTTSTASNHHSRQPRSPTVSPFSSNFCTNSSDSVDESKRKSIESPSQTNFGPVPSQIEVQNAISDLRRVMNGFCATNSTDSSRTLMKSLGQNRLLDACHLLQTDASVQKLVLAISSDVEVWNAILKNDAVRDLQRSLPDPATKDKATRYEDFDSASLLIKWIFSFMKLKMVELIEKLEVFVFETLKSVSKQTNSTSKVDDMLEEKVRSSLLLSVVVLLIVVVTRSIET